MEKKYNNVIVQFNSELKSLRNECYVKSQKIDNLSKNSAVLEKRLETVESFRKQLQNTIGMWDQLSTKDDKTKSEQKPDSFECEVCQLVQPETTRTLFNPCGHGSCSNCATKLRSCHICDEKIEEKSQQFG